jgi:4-carboxymuconolactone decarboxylase
MSNTLSTRFLELIILRVAWRVKSAYEWHNHVGYGLNAGLTLEEIAAIRDYPEGGNWSEEDELRHPALGRRADRRRHVERRRPGNAGQVFRQAPEDAPGLLDRPLCDDQLGAGRDGGDIEGGADQIGFDLKTASGKTPRQDLQARRNRGLGRDARLLRPAAVSPRRYPAARPGQFRLPQVDRTLGRG